MYVTTIYVLVKVLMLGYEPVFLLGYNSDDTIIAFFFKRKKETPVDKHLHRGERIILFSFYISFLFLPVPILPGR